MGRAPGVFPRAVRLCRDSWGKVRSCRLVRQMSPRAAPHAVWIGLLLAISSLVGCSLLLDTGEDGLAGGDVCSPRCQADELCVGGTCLPLDCEDKDCGDGALCQNNQCVTLACIGVTCVDGQGCNDGRCLPLDCNGVPCGAGELCLDGACKDVRCAGISCPTGQVCLAGACQGCAERETSCANGIDEDCDGKIDCADSDCRAEACSDGLLCTIGETCDVLGQCSGGRETACDAPLANADCFIVPGTCEEGRGCNYPRRPTGTACRDDNPCTENTTCDAQGTCTSGTRRICNTPPSECFEAVGQCNDANGECEYVPKPQGSACSDASECRVGGVCDGMGRCGGGSPSADGVKCGVTPGGRCCGGECKDISNDAANCGGCGFRCAGGFACNPITTTVCSAAAGPISGRCGCAGNSVQQCQLNAGVPQACRGPTAPGQVVPESNVCVPRSCSPGQQVVQPGPIDQCAPYCAY